MTIKDIYPKCRTLLEDGVWLSLTDTPELINNPEKFSDILKMGYRNKQLPGFLSNLAQIEFALYQIRSGLDLIPEEVSHLTVNPTLNILELEWNKLAEMFRSSEISDIKPEPSGEMLLLWHDPKRGFECIEPAASEDLLALKMVVEDIPAETIAESAKVPIGAVDETIERTIKKGLLLIPDTLIRREPGFVLKDNLGDAKSMKAHFFTLQWHVTQACDLNCKHCYDRSDRSTLTLDQGFKILKDLRNFCHSKHVRGHITFSGGNPLLYPYFSDLYRTASESGFSLSILGNPAPKSRIKELIDTATPKFFQISMEGLQDYNDYIRGPGHFKKAISFLEILKDLNVFSMVMLTLTKDNIDQVLPLAEKLRKHTDHFTFNRLSQVGEGANLLLPSRDEYRAFLKEYIDAASVNPIMGLKDNLFNILRYEKRINTTGGCTGFGCGAAFNFLTLLPDGELHACRKFPSLLGNIANNSLTDIYESDLAKKYRMGSASCNSCSIKPSCGGCMASAFSNSLDIFKDRDPYCFIG